MNAVKNLLLGVVLAFSVGAVMSMSYDDAVADQAEYCKMVELEAWPDFRGVGEACKGKVVD